MERSRHASHLASRSYRGGIPDLGGGDEVAGAGGGGVGAAFSGASAMTRGEGADAIRGRQKETHRERRRQRGRRWLLALALSLRECRALEPFGSGANCQGVAVRAEPGRAGPEKDQFCCGSNKMAIEALAQPAIVSRGLQKKCFFSDSYFSFYSKW